MNFSKDKKQMIKKETLNSADVIYLITPDRYANGDEKNDEIDLLLEKPNRKNKDGRHGGDLQGIINNLDYIEDMGFTQIWLNQFWKIISLIIPIMDTQPLTTIKLILDSDPINFTLNYLNKLGKETSG